MVFDIITMQSIVIIIIEIFHNGPVTTYYSYYSCSLNQTIQTQNSQRILYHAKFTSNEFGSAP